MEKLIQEPALPVTHEQFESIPTYKGISKRFYAACAAMQGLMANNVNELTTEQLVAVSYECADELLKQENE